MVKKKLIKMLGEYKEDFEIWWAFEVIVRLMITVVFLYTIGNALKSVNYEYEIWASMFIGIIFIVWSLRPIYELIKNIKITKGDEIEE